jgi:hypothetical protein
VDQAHQGPVDAGRRLAGVVVPAGRPGDRRGQAPGLGHPGAQLAVVDPQHRPLGVDERGSAPHPHQDLLLLLGDEGPGHQLAQVVEQPGGEEGVRGPGAQLRSQPLAEDRHRHAVGPEGGGVQVVAREAPGDHRRVGHAGGQLADPLHPQQRHRLPHRLGLAAEPEVGRVGHPQQVGGERQVGADHPLVVGGAGPRVAGQGPEPGQGRGEGGQLLHPAEEELGGDHRTTSSPWEATVQRPDPTWSRAVRDLAPPTSSARMMTPAFQNIFRRMV